MACSNVHNSPAQAGGKRRRRKSMKKSHKKHHSKSHKKSHKKRARKSHKKRSKRGGSGALAALKTALVPFLLFKAQKHLQKKKRGKTQKRRR